MRTGFIRNPLKDGNVKYLEGRRNGTELTFESRQNGIRQNGSRPNGSRRNGNTQNRPPCAATKLIELHSLLEYKNQ